MTQIQTASIAFTQISSIVFAIAAIATLRLLHHFIFSSRPYRGLPIVTADRKKGKWDLFRPGYYDWLQYGSSMLSKGLAEFSGPFQVLTHSGYSIVLPNRFAHELRNRPELHFAEGVAHSFFINYPGFDGGRQLIHENAFMRDMTKRVTQNLGAATLDIVDEADTAFSDIFCEDPAWQTRTMKGDLQEIVSRLSSRIFLGPQLCRDPEWLDTAKSYTTDFFTATQDLRLVPSFLRLFLHLFIPRCQNLWRQVKRARRLILAEVEKQHELFQTSEKPSKPSTVIQYMMQMAKNDQSRPMDYVATQLGLSMAAIHTTSETLSRCVFQLAETPEIAQPLRKEVIEVLRENGWQKTSLYKMKLLDSFLKEVMRLHQFDKVSMIRHARKEVTLADGTVIPAGSLLMIADDRGSDGATYSEPGKFKVGRFQSLRQKPGQETSHQFVTTSPEYMLFGHGRHACPGRFFASNELKIALCFLLMRYDLRLPEGYALPPELTFETQPTSKPATKIQIRRRREEIDVASPDVAFEVT